MVEWLCVWLFFGSTVILELSEGQLLDISSPVEATASSFNVSSSGVKFAPQLAIQADTSRVGSACFISNEEANPWFTLKFKSVTAISHVRLVVKDKPNNGLPSDFSLNGMNKLRVYLSNSSILDNSKRPCGSPWTYSGRRNEILLDCGNDLKGKFLHVTVPSDSETYLLICSIVLNREPGPQYPLNLFEERTTAVSSGEDSNRPLSLAIDGNSSRDIAACSYVKGSDSGSWLRIDIKSVRYISKVLILFKDKGADTIFVGRSLKKNGARDNAKCKGSTATIERVPWKRYTCSQPVLGEFIYIQTSNKSMNICEIKVFYDNLLNIYSPVNVSASDQGSPSGIGFIWTPTDGILDSQTFISSKSSKAWWRMEFPVENVISGLVVYTRSLNPTELNQMNGFAVYIGNISGGNGSSNAQCGKPWTAIQTNEIAVNCSDGLTGRYLYVAAADSSDAALYLSEIVIYGCQVPTAIITSNVSNEILNNSQSANLTCKATTAGCTVEKLIWSGPDGNTIDTISRMSLGVSRVSSIVVAGFTFGGRHTCTVTFQSGSVSSHYDVSVKVVVKAMPDILTVSAGNETDLFCVANGYPEPALTLKKDNATISKGVSDRKYEVMNKFNKHLKIGPVSLSDNGTVYSCEARQGSFVTSTETTLIVKPIVTFLSSPKSVDGIVGEKATLTCEATGMSLEVIEWTVGDKVSDNVTNSSETIKGGIRSTLIIEKLQLSHGSLQYRCIARGIKMSPDILIGASNAATIRVLGSITFEDMAYDIEKTLRNPFSCLFTANPKPNASLQLDGVTIVEKPVETRKKNEYTISLPIKKIELNTTGLYSCVISFSGSLVKNVTRTAQLQAFPAVTLTSNVTIKITTPRTVNLTCVASGFPLPNIVWIHAVGSDSFDVTTFSFSRRDNATRSTASQLTLNRAYHNNGGKYTCLARNSLKKNGQPVVVNSSSTSIQVSAIVAKQSSSANATWGSSIVLFCNASGYPAPDISWTLGNKTVSQGVSITKGSAFSLSYLHLTMLHAISDGGRYKCKAVNVAGSGDSALISLRFTPRVVIPPTSVSAAFGKQLKLKCTVGSFPAVNNVVWYKNGQKIVNESLSLVLSKNVTAITSRYRVKPATETACGNYSCYSSSSTTPQTAIVSVSSAAFIYTNSSSVVEGGILTFSCRAVGCPTPLILWRFSSTGSDKFDDVVDGTGVQVESRKINATTNTSMLTIRNTDRSRSGTYRCSSTNDAMKKKKAYSDKNVIVYYVSFFNVSSHVTSDAGEAFQLSCTPQGNPLLTKVTWMKGPVENKTDGKLVSGGNRSVITRDTTVVTLTVQKSIRLDTGYYWCQFPGVVGPVRSSKVRVTIKGRPAFIPVSEIQVSSHAINVTLTWPKPSDGFRSPLYYEVWYRNSTSLNFTNLKEINATSNYTTVSIVGLIPYTTYFAKIVPRNILGAAENVDEFNITTNVSAPSAPRNLTVTATSSTSLFASWREPKNPNGPINVYNVYLQSVSDVSEIQKRSSLPVQPVKNVSVNSVNISELEKFTLYYVVVTAANKDNSGYLEGPDSSRVRIRTKPDAPSVPRNVSVVAIDDTRLKVTWFPPSPSNGIIASYQIFYEERLKFSIHNLTRNVTSRGPELSAVIPELTAFTNYTVAVRAYTTSNGNLSKLSVGQTEQGLPSAPLNLTVVSAHPTVMVLSWNRPKYPRGIILNYLIRVHGTKSYIDVEGKSITNTTEMETTTKDDRARFSVQSLWPDFTYTVTVAAMTSKSKGSTSKAVEATTEVDTPLPPVSGQESARTTSTVTLTLTRPSNRNGDIQSVLLLVTELKDVPRAADMNFSSSPIIPYSENITAGEPYVAAEFDYDNFPNSFILGDDTVTGKYRNVPLKSGTRYAHALRSVSATKTQLVSTSVLAEAKTASKPQTISSGNGSNSAAVAGAVVAVVLVILAVVLIFIIVRRRRARKEAVLSRLTSEKIKDEGVLMSNFVKPAVSSVEEEIDGIAGSTIVLRIDMTGHPWPEPKIHWRCSGSDLPGNDRRFGLSSDGSLKISDFCEEDAGLYQCTVSNTAGTSKCQIRLNVGAKAVDQSKGPVAMDEFEEHVKELHENNNDGFLSEFSVLGQNVLRNPSSTVAKLECNKSKNRYGNIVPYDRNRVVLEEQHNEPGSDYINASYVDAYSLPKGYIACQGPNDTTINDFWRMIWQENVRTIVMVTNIKEKGKVKCSQYWPELNQDDHYGAITVTSREELFLPQSVVRTFSLTHSRDDNPDRRSLKHFHFTGWPDHGVPKYAMPLLKLLKRVRANQSLQNDSPVVVHCSAGVGRTGAFIVIDYSLERLKQEKNIDIFNLIKELRKQRPNMVQTEDQYVFCHNAILEYVLCGDTSVSVLNLQIHIRQQNQADSQTGKTGFEKDLEILERISPGEEKFSYSVGRRAVNAKKNRYTSCPPPDEIRICLSPVPGQPSDSSYISAATVDGYQQSKIYIATQGPLEETVADFWRLVWEKKCQFVVMVTQLEENGKEMSVQYWPSEGTAEFAMMSVTMQDEKQHEEYTMRKFLINNKNAEASDPRIITQFHYLGWPDGQLPGNPSHLLDMINKLERKQSKADKNSVVVMCSDGVHRCGMFCAISIIIEALKTEQVVDVFQVVRALRLQNPAFVNGLEEYKFCYNVAQEFLDSFDT